MELSEDVVKQVVQKKLGTCRFDIIDFSVTRPKGDSFGFLSTNNILTVDLKHNSQVKQFRFFMKSVVRGNEYHNEILNTMGVNKREMYLYKEVLNVVKKYLPKKVFPECYYSTETVLIMEDLSEIGYKCKSVHEYFDIDHIHSTLEQLANFHCASITYEIKEKVSIIDKFPDLSEESLFTTEEDHPCTKYLKVTVKVIDRVMEVYCEHIPQEIKEKVLESLSYLHKYVKPSEKELNVLSHSDLWANNLMFLYGLDKEILSTYIIDFQLARYLPPAFDVLMSIYFLTSPAMRESEDEGVEHLLIYYYNHLSKGLEWNGIDVKDVLTWDNFKTMCNSNLPKMLAFAIQYFHYITVPAGLLMPIMQSAEKYKHYVEVDRSDILLEVMRTDEPYRRRLIQALNDAFNYYKKQPA